MIHTYFVTAVIAAALSGVGTWQIQTWRFDAKEKQRLQAQHELYRRAEKTANAASTTFEQDRTKNENRTRNIYVAVDKIIDRPVYRNICVDADGLQQLNGAIRRADSASELSRPMSGPSTGR